MKKITLYCDGASKGNPGDAGIGVILSASDGSVIKEIGEYIGKTTNNVAEYTALISGLKECVSLGAEEVEISTDSQLMARQISGVYRVKADNLIPLFTEAKSLIRKFKKVSITHVMREFNKRADELANEGVKKQGRTQSFDEDVNELTVKDIIAQCAEWMRSQVDKAHARGIILGLSGGIDSAVVAGIAKIACGDNVFGVMMPCHSSSSSLEDAVIAADAFGIKTTVVDLTESYDSIKAAMPSLKPCGYTNIAPRLRMNTLYAIGADMGYLVAGTGNLTETMIGYFTKWGDGGCDIKPIASFYKYEVYDIARELGVPERLIAKPPTADLWEGQTDEGEIGLTYDELDNILQALADRRTPDANSDKVTRVKKLMAASQHKRSEVPVFEPKR